MLNRCSCSNFKGKQLKIRYRTSNFQIIRKKEGMEENPITLINDSKGIKNMQRKGIFVRTKYIDVINPNMSLLNMKGINLPIRYF